MANVDLAVGVIAAGAALGGVGLTLLGEQRRRRWEDRRRWADVKRHACREFLYASRTLYSHVRALKTSGLDQRKLRTRLDDLAAKVEAGNHGPEVQAEMSRIKAGVTILKEKHNELEPLIGPTWERVNEASADIVLLCSPTLQDLASAHQALIMQIHEKTLDALPVPQGFAFVGKAEELVSKSQDTLRVQIRKELGVDHGR